MTFPNLDFFTRTAIIFIDPCLPDSHIMDCNEHFLKLTGYERHEVIGRHGRFLAGPATDRETRRLFREAMQAERPFMGELLLYKKDGTTFVSAVTVSPLFDDAGEFAGVLASFVKSSLDSLARDRCSDVRIRNAMDAIARLTPRQTEVLSGLTAGKPVKQIAHDLGLSERTIKMHRTAMLRTLGVSSNVEAIRIAIESGCC